MQHLTNTLAAVTAALCLSITAFVPAAHATAEKAAAFYEEALKRFEKDDTAGAVVQLKSAIQQDQKMLAAHLLLGKALARQGEYKSAEAAFDEAIKQGVSRAEVALPLARLYLAVGEPKKVIDNISPSGMVPGLQVEVLTLRGTAYAESGNTRDAIRSFGEARAVDPRSALPYIAEVPVLLAAGQRDQARAAAKKALELGPEMAAAWNMQASVKHAALDINGALADYDRAIVLDPRYVDARVARAAIMVDLKRDLDALKDLDFLKVLAPGEPRSGFLRALVASHKGDQAAVAAELKAVAEYLDGMPPAWMARREQFLMVAALAHLSLNNREKAREYLDGVVGRNGNNVAARKLLASMYVDQRDYVRAATQLDVLRRLQPEDPQLLLLLGRMELGKHRYAQATEFLEKAAAKIGTAEANRSLGFGQLGLGQDDLGQASLEKALAADPGDSIAGTTLAMLHIRHGRPQKALQIAEGLVKANSRNLTALNFLGTVRGATGDKTGARAAYEQLLALESGFRPAIFNLARLDLSEGKVDAARARLNALLSKRADDTDALFELAGVERHAGRPAEAVRSLKKAHESQRTDPRPGLALMDLHTAQRQPSAALAIGKELVSKYPESLPVQLALGRAYLGVGDARSARGVFQGATRLAEFDPDQQVQIGRLQLAANNADGALYNAQKALQGRPDDVAALALTVEAEARRNDFAKADAALRTMNAKHPNHAYTAIAAGNLAMLRRQFPAAVAAYKTALTRQESTATALDVVRAQVAAGDVGKAVTFLEGWATKHPGDVNIQKALAETYLRAGQLPAARQSYAKVIAASPNDAMLRNNYASLLQQLGDPSAQLEAESAYKLAPQNPTIADTLGWILVQKGQLETGVRYLREARLRNPESLETRYHLAFALTKLGRKVEAREELTTVLAAFVRGAQPGQDVVQLKRELGL